MTTKAVPRPCQCGAMARSIRGEGMCGERGWRVVAMCGNAIFTAGRGAGVRDGNIVAWNNYGRTYCPRERPDAR